MLFWRELDKRLEFGLEKTKPLSVQNLLDCSGETLEAKNGEKNADDGGLACVVSEV